MTDPVFFTPGGSDALSHTKRFLMEKGFSFTDVPNKNVSHLILGAPAFSDDGSLKGGGQLEDILCQLKKDITVLGGNLNVPALAGYRSADLLCDPLYLAENAQITAYCAVFLATQVLPVIWQGCPVLVLGWGRIGKCLSALLSRMGAIVTVAARKESDRAILSAMGFETEDIHHLGYGLLRHRVLFNTVPELILTEENSLHCREDCVKIDLASRRGMVGRNVIWARGLPGQYAPESAGQLIAKTILRLIS